MKGPGIPSGNINESSIYLQDIAPTTIELAGGQVPDTYQSKSLLPLIRGESTQHYSAIYGLYNLIEDPYEMQDLAEWSDSEPIIRRLMHRLTELQRDTGDELDLQTLFSKWM